MDDPDPANGPIPARHWSTEYHRAAHTAFDLLRHELKQVQRESRPERQEARRLQRRLDGLETAYERMPEAKKKNDDYVPAEPRDWPIEDKQKVLLQLSVILYNPRLARIGLGDQYRLQQLWEVGRFREIDRLCHEAGRSVAEQSTELKQLLDSYSPRQAAEVAGLTSSRATQKRRARRASTTEQLRLTAKRTRTVRAAALRPGR